MKLQRAQLERFVTNSIEVLLVAALFVIASRYWAIDEHVVYAAILGGVALIAVSRTKNLRPTLAGLIPAILFIAFVGWLVVSSLWAPNIPLSLGRAFTVAIIALTAVVLGLSLSVSVVARGLTLGVALLILHASLNDSLGPLGFLSLGSEPGLFTNTSEMTFLLGVGVAAAVTLSLAGRFRAAIYLLVAVLFLVAAAGIVVLTMFFATAGAVIVLLMILHLRYSGVRQRQMLRGVYPVLVAAGVALFWVFREPLLRPLGEAPDLSGRTIIWEWYFEAFLWEPLVGIGWGNTYNWPLTPGDIYPTGQFFTAHNGFLDVGLVAGIVGVGLIVATLVMVFIRGASHAMNHANPAQYVFVPVLISYIVINDIMATSIPRYIGVFLVGTLVGLVTRESSQAPNDPATPAPAVVASRS